MRVVTTGFRNSLESPHSGDLPVLLATITHESISTPVRVSSDLVDYLYLGDIYYGLGFGMSLFSDDDQPPRAQVSITNYDRRIGQAVLLIDTSPVLQVLMFDREDFDNATPRAPIGTPVVQYGLRGVLLRNVKCDYLQLTADIAGPDLSTEPYPSIRTTPDRTPGLYRG